jgi:DNA-binding YbaB/EbfC family protein
MQAAQAAAQSATVEGSAGGGIVRVTLTGTGEAVAVHIDPAAVDPDDCEMLEDLVLAALRDAMAQSQALQADALGHIDLGGLGGLLGGADQP